MTIFRMLTTMAALVLLFTVVTTRAVQAQNLCPVPPPDYPGTPFIDGGCYTTLMTNPTDPTKQCSVEICYCYRIVNLGGGNYLYDFFISSVAEMQDGCFGLIGLQFDDLLRAAAEQFIRDNPRGWPCPPCDQAETQWRAVNAACYEIVNAHGPRKEIRPCGGYVGYCFDEYEVCCENGVPVIKVISSWTTGNCPTPPPGSTCFELCE